MIDTEIDLIINLKVIALLLFLNTNLSLEIVTRKLNIYLLSNGIDGIIIVTNVDKNLNLIYDTLGSEAITVLLYCPNNCVVEKSLKKLKEMNSCKSIDYI